MELLNLKPDVYHYCRNFDKDEFKCGVMLLISSDQKFLFHFTLVSDGNLDCTFVTDKDGKLCDDEKNRIYLSKSKVELPCQEFVDRKIAFLEGFVWDEKFEPVGLLECLWEVEEEESDWDSDMD
jgi:hypothetical protein